MFGEPTLGKTQSSQVVVVPHQGLYVTLYLQNSIISSCQVKLIHHAHSSL